MEKKKKKEYNHLNIEKKWQKEWDKKKIYKTLDSFKKPKYYVLDMFPYPSGEGLHVGHPKGYIATDIISRMKRMQGFNVLHPMGFDAFGLPAENYAIKMKINPSIAVARNVTRFKKQLKIIGLDYDWSREINTTNPKFYKWTQWIFLQMFKKGLAYESYEPINWCPSCKTGLANEDLEDGKCERCGSEIVQKPMRQWVLRITNYADKLLKDLSLLDWPESIKESQRNWIGKSEGAEIEFKVGNNKEKVNIILMHGKNTSPSKNWYPWLAEKVKKMGINFTAPTLPNANNPKIEEWINEIDKTNPNQNSILVGHSRGGVAILRWLEKQPDSFRIKKVILIATNSGNSIKGDKTENNKGFFTKNGYDFPKIKQHCDNFVVLHSKDDEWVPFEAGQENANNLDAKFLQFVDKGHFGSKLLKQEIPELLRELLVIDKEDILILHGWENNSKSGFIPELKKHLEKKGHNVFALNMPNTNAPNFDEWYKFLEKKIKENNLKNFSVVGHSMGGGLALKLSEKYKIKKLILIAPIGFEKPNSKYFSQFEKKLTEEEMNIFKNFQNRNLNEQSVKNNIDEISFIFGKDDRWITKEIRDFYIKKFKNVADFRILEGKGHFEGIKKIPEIENIFDSEVIKVFTTRPDTLFGATYCVLAPEHKLVDKLKNQIKNWVEVEKYRKEVTKKTEIERTAEGKEKTGIELKGVKAINPANKEEIPIFVADYVLAHYGTGAIMAVPAHDGRDYQFAKKYNLLITPVQYKMDIDKSIAISDQGHGFEILKKILEKTPLCIGNNYEKYWLINSGVFSKMNAEEAKKEITKFVGGEWVTRYKLRDWVFSRQRYWGEPIPIIHCEKCGVVPVPEKDLPVILPKVKSYEPTGTGDGPLAEIEDWVNVKCPKCGRIGKRETNTMPQWAGSSWYYLRYMDPNNNKILVDKKKEKYWNEVDFYVGGAEHATRHLIYARFWHKFLYEISAVSNPEPFKKLQSVGLIIGEDGKKMSKRFGNVINPDDIIKIYGADTLRLYEMFMGPFKQAISWNTQSIIGPRRFLEKIWKISEQIIRQNKEKTNKELEKTLHKTIKKVTEDIENMNFNTAISTMMILVNDIELHNSEIIQKDFKLFLQILAPFVPHITEEIWATLKEKKSIHLSSWPKWNNEKIIEENIKIAIQVNGKVRAEIMILRNMTEEKVKLLAQKNKDVINWIEGKEIKRIIYIAGRIINIVV